MSTRTRPVKADDRQQYPNGHLFGTWEARRWTPRKGNFATVRQQQMVELVRGELIERLDDLLCAAVPVWEHQFGMPKAQGYSLIQCVQMALFPDEYADDPEAAERIAQLIGARAALVPKDGPIERVGWEAFEAYAHSLGVELDDEPEPAEEVIHAGTSAVGPGVSLPRSERAVLAARQR
jgi:hypothetical protein